MLQHLFIEDRRADEAVRSKEVAGSFSLLLRRYGDLSLGRVYPLICFHRGEVTNYIYLNAMHP